MILIRLYKFHYPRLSIMACVDDLPLSRVRESEKDRARLNPIKHTLINEQLATTTIQPDFIV